MTVGGHSLALSTLLLHAAAALRHVRDGRSLTEALSGVPEVARAGTQALAFFSLRRLGLALALRQALSARTPRADIDALLLTALALLSQTGEDAPYDDHTLVNQAVLAARQLQTASAGFVNAVLRRFLREREAQLTAARQHPQARFNHAPWWIARLQSDWPASWQVLLAQAHRPPPMTLRVNAQRTSVADYLVRLQVAGLPGQALHANTLMAAGALHDAVCTAIVLDKACPVNALPGFSDGDVSVQDAAAQLAAPLLLRGMPRGRGLRVLDACAAPGGKTAHLLEIDPSLHVTALDSDARRLERVEQTMQRLHLRATVTVGDARQPGTWWDGAPFDAVLLDAPCTASGIVRRHPDIAWLRRASDVQALATVQAQLLGALWGVLAPGGVMVYASCSIFKAEGDHQIDAFLQRPMTAAAQRDPASPGHLLPLPDNPESMAVHDGFFYARLLKPR